MSGIGLCCHVDSADINYRWRGVFDSGLSDGGSQLCNDEVSCTSVASDFPQSHRGKLAGLFRSLHLNLVSRGFLQDTRHLVANHDLRCARAGPRHCKYVFHSNRNLLWSPGYWSGSIYLEVNDPNEYVRFSNFTLT